MLILIGELNGQKIQIPVTADTGAGTPVGSYLYLEKKSDPSGYLFCDGTRFDPTKYPALYQYLGTDELPDWREFSPVGAEQNTTNVYDAQTNPNGIIHDHDVYTEGEAKDDQLQAHTHNIQTFSNAGSSPSIYRSGVNGTDPRNIESEGISQGRAGTVTRGKRKAVFIYIKATSGLTENQQENVLNTINENLSYSTTEHKTGKKWIDGKDIYEQTFEVGIGVPTGTWVDIISKVSIPNIAKLITHSETWGDNEQINYASAVGITPNSSAIIRYPGADTASVTLQTISLEYTKTTD